MTLNLAEIDFDYDFFSTTMPDGSLLILNKVSESLSSSGEEATEIKCINIIVQPVNTDGNLICSPVIGMGNDYLKLNSAYDYLQGQVLTEDNLEYCTMELFEDE